MLWSARASLIAAALVMSSTSVAQGVDPRANATTARARLRVFEGSYRVTSGIPGDTATTIWRWRPVLGGKYLELEEVLKVKFRATLGFDSTSSRYRMSLLDAGSGAVDIYDGDFDASGTLILQNPNYWRMVLTPTARGLFWRFARSTDRGVSWRENPTSEMIRTAEP